MINSALQDAVLSTSAAEAHMNEVLYKALSLYSLSKFNPRPVLSGEREGERERGVCSPAYYISLY